MGTHDTAPQRSAESGDEVFGWDTSAGQEAYFPIGPGSDEIPVGSVFQTGVPFGGSTRLYRGRSFDAVNGGHNHLALFEKGNLDRSIAGIIASSTSIGAASAVQIAVGQSSGGVLRGGLRSIGTASVIELIEFDAGGKTWVGLRATTTTLGGAGLSNPALFGTANVSYPMDAVQSYAPGDVSAVTAFSGSAAKFGGAPADPIGQNQPLYISGGAGTAKEVMVDGSGFIVEV